MHAFLLTPKCINDGGDTDGDGICDAWEKYGYTDPNTGKFVDLPAMGADPMHKDIFVQADYMALPPLTTCGSTGCAFGHTHNPKAAIKKVILAFANAPVANPVWNHGHQSSRRLRLGLHHESADRCDLGRYPIPSASYS